MTMTMMTMNWKSTGDGVEAALDMAPGPLEDLKLSEVESESESSDDNDDETKQYYQGQEDEGIGGSKPKPGTPTMPDSSGNPNGSKSEHSARKTSSYQRQGSQQ